MLFGTTLHSPRHLNVRIHRTQGRSVAFCALFSADSLGDSACHSVSHMALFREMTALCAHVKTSNGLFQTQEYLAVCQKLVDMTNTFGTTFTLVQKDMTRNIGIINKQYQTDVTNFQGLFAMALQVPLL